MKHFYLLYLFIMFSIGLVSLGVAIFLYLKTKEAILRYYLYFFTSYSLLSASSVGVSYAYTNIPGLEERFLETFPEFFAVLVMFTAPLFMHFILDTTNARIKNSIIGGLAFIIIVQHPLQYVIQNPLVARINASIGGILFFAVFVYTVAIGLRGYRKVENENEKRLATYFTLLLALSVPGLILDFIIDDVLNFAPVFFPLLYAILSVIFTYKFIQLYGPHHQITPQISPESESKPISDEHLFQEYTLSPREQEVARLILEGCSNQEIGEKLFISLSTVKTHVSNVYQKFGVKNRVEFITFFQNARTGRELPSISPAASE